MSSATVLASPRHLSYLVLHWFWFLIESKLLKLTTSFVSDHHPPAAAMLVVRPSKVPLAVRTGATLLLLSCCLLAFSCALEGNNCSCNTANSHCDEFGVCRCDPGWDGDFCDVCVPMPGCVHGSCLQPWQCTCEPGWGGRFCDKDLSMCSQQQPCLNGATCVTEDSGDFSCVCAKGFHGLTCQWRTGPCHRRRSLCKNGGLCEDADGFAEAPMCRCLAGFTGPRCETDVDDCLMMPCGRGATCLDGINRFSCLCPVGFTGRFCTVNLDDCASQPCLNDGRCVDLAGGFHCVCRPGFTGNTCERPLRHNNSSRDATGPGWTTPDRDGSWHGNRPLRVTGHCWCCVHAPCGSSSSSSQGDDSRGQRTTCDEPESRIPFQNTAEPQKKRLNEQVIQT
ncbi:transcript variant X2 [Nothobranchius furzeri]|uniref:Transcript variant X2 n=2 Tax=Nothobranchius furzeri TaxID=105023 RepID=A0A9D3B9Q6_NOTFU|nr:transcript variant X2 [Nothobranchius furzeri]